MPYRPETEPKVKASSAGAGVGGVTAGLVLWALAEYVFGGEVPEPVSLFVLAVLPLALSWAAGYWRNSQPTGGEHRREMP